MTAGWCTFPRMSDRAFPVLYVQRVLETAEFYQRLGFVETYRMAEGDDAGFVAMRRGVHEMGVVSVNWPISNLGIEIGASPRGEMFVYVDDVDATVESMRVAGIHVLQEPADMPWGERIAYVADPAGNPVCLALAVAGQPRPSEVP